MLTVPMAKGAHGSHENGCSATLRYCGTRASPAHLAGVPLLSRCVLTDVEEGGETAFPQDSVWTDPALPDKLGGPKGWSDCAKVRCS